MKTHKTPIDALLAFLSGEGAHASFDEAVDRFPVKLRGRRPEGCPHTAWQLLEHTRIAQWDIVRFCTDRLHESPPWPEGYWPRSDGPASPAGWRTSIEMFRADLDALKKLVAAPKTDLFARIPWGTGQTIFREALLVGDHNAYHLGQLVLVRRLLGAWRK